MHLADQTIIGVLGDWECFVPPGGPRIPLRNVQSLQLVRCAKNFTAQQSVVVGHQQHFVQRRRRAQSCGGIKIDIGQ